jgi:site-specific DNA-methyltransferase (adenine-specific)
MKNLSETFNRDCVEAMKEFPDNYFDLAVVDPPYGDFNGTIERTGGSWSKKYQRDNSIKKWDFAPSAEYFNELFRISKNQIVWGGNYFKLPPSKHFLIWEKITISESFSMAMVEYAWSSINDNAKLFKYRPQRENGIHPTQKPIALYDWIFTNYAKPNDKILDTHLGSQSSRIAAYKAGLDFTGFELDKEYFEQGNKRFNDFLTVYEQEVGKEKILNNQTRLF